MIDIAVADGLCDVSFAVSIESVRVSIFTEEDIPSLIDNVIISDMSLDKFISACGGVFDPFG